MKETWKQVGGNEGGWQEIRAEFDAILTDSQVWAAAGCIGYALRSTFGRGARFARPTAPGLARQVLGSARVSGSARGSGCGRWLWVR